MADEEVWQMKSLLLSKSVDRYFIEINWVSALIVPNGTKVAGRGGIVSEYFEHVSVRDYIWDILKQNRGE